MDGGAWWAAVHGVAKSQTRLSGFTFTFHFHALEKEMATHSSVLAWRIPGTAEPGGLLSMGSHRVGYDWSDLAAAASSQSRLLILPQELGHKGQQHHRFGGTVFTETERKGLTEQTKLSGLYLPHTNNSAQWGAGGQQRYVTWRNRCDTC